MEAEEKRETELINECLRELNESQRESARLRDELGKKAENSAKQAEEITQLLGQIVDLQKKVPSTLMILRHFEINSCTITSFRGCSALGANVDETRVDVVIVLAKARYICNRYNSK